MSNIIQHPYHLVNESPWPLLASIGALLITRGLASWFHEQSINLIIIGLILTLAVAIQWWSDIRHEGSFQGKHSLLVEVGLRYGILLFIVSEVLFFSSFFWAFFHRSLAPTVELGGSWPPVGISPFNPFEVPLLNTLILLSSGLRVTWAHHAVISANHDQAIKGLFITVLLGAYFTALQALEYFEARFRIADRVYGATFFVATGFHGLHVIVGTLFLLACTLRLLKGHLSSQHHFGFEAAAWYWHFVDVVWLFLYLTIYWWGGA